MKPETRLRYAQRMEPVLRWLASHPDSTPDLYYLAELACLSPYHFHRVYRALLGETVNGTMQRIRMHRAAIALADSEDSMRVVASRAGYTSEAAFNRAFGAFFGMPPGRYRDTRSAPLDPQEPSMYPISVESFPATTLAVLRHSGDYQAIGAVFARVFMLAAAHGLAQPNSTGFGIYFDDPEQVPVAQLRSLAGVPVASNAVIGGYLDRFEIPAGRCAVLTYTGPYNEMTRPYQWLFSEWLPNSGLEPADFPMFEQYLNAPRSTPASQLQTKICLPVK
ncbi:AraC family transcriptional regulator [Pandoraea anhela]|nr:AraC family transcriptional regulator [Pandoraea anhela]